MFIWLPKAKWFWTAVNIVAWVSVAAYLTAMVVWPWVSSGFDWTYVQKVWTHWQGLNVGVLAFSASILALTQMQNKANEERRLEKERQEHQLKVEHDRAEAERKRRLANALSFLPQELSDLTEYFRLSMHLLSEAWANVTIPRRQDRPPFGQTAPTLPSTYAIVFRECMEYADQDLYEFLSGFLKKLQVHNARLTSLVTELSPDSHVIVIPQNIIAYLYRAAELQVILNRLFPYARADDQPLETSPFTWEEYRAALSLNDIEPEDFDDLQAFIERAIARQNAQAEGAADE